MILFVKKHQIELRDNGKSVNEGGGLVIDKRLKVKKNWKKNGKILF